MSHVPSLGSSIRAARQRQHLSQQTLARQLGCTKGTISHYEHDQTRPNYDRLMRLCQLLDIAEVLVLHTCAHCGRST